MSDARQRAAWDHTSQILAIIANVNRDPKRTRAYSADDFHPFKRTGRSGRQSVPREQFERAILSEAERHGGVKAESLPSQ